MAINHLLNIMRRESEATLGGYSHPRIGTITSYDPDNYCAKVKIQPEETETGFLPICSPWVGNGWGLFCPPSSGDMVLVLFQEGNFEAGLIVLAAFNNEERPLPVQPGEFWLVHKTGSSLKLKNDGSIELNGLTKVNGDLIVSGNVSDQNGSMQEMRNTYNIHDHNDPDSGITGPANQPM